MPATMRGPPSNAQLCCYAVLAVLAVLRLYLLGCGCACCCSCAHRLVGERCHYPKSIIPVTRKRRKIAPTDPD